MCRVANVFYGRCQHPQLIEIQGWCHRRAFLPRSESSSCQGKELIVLDTFCHACALRQMHQYVDRMRGQLREYWKAATHVRRHLVHTRHRLDACSHAVTQLSRTFHQFVATHNHRCGTEFKVWMKKFRRDPMAEGAPLPRPRLPCLHWPDPQMWIERAKARADASLATRRLVDDDRDRDSGDEDDHFSVMLYGCLHDDVASEYGSEDDG
ncbi:MAG: hypothetical protein M1826_004017 [Phylliscum demangeonii]|nr:MAG: hypothetical protein M1826_004017 [Phylliscum demangeonii]